jgi:hypothetical protein
VADASSSSDDYFFLAAFFAGFFAAFFVAMSTPPPFDFKNGDRACGIAEFVLSVKSSLHNLFRSAGIGVNLR